MAAGGNGHLAVPTPPRPDPARSPWRWRPRAAASAILAGNGLFLAACAAGVALRALAMAAYRPVVWFGDSFDYIRYAVRPAPDPIRPDGYAFFLWALKPLHSFTVVTTVQHLLGLGAAVAVYALLRRWSLPGWGATLAAAPVLFDPRQVLLEQALLSEALFTACLVAAVVVLLWRRVPTLRQAAAIGLLLAIATLSRPVALPLLALAAGALLARRAGWRVTATTVAACLLPLGCYAAWFDSSTGRFALSSSDGLILWSRTMSFADCGQLKPPPSERRLCPDPRGQQRLAGWGSVATSWPWSFLLDKKQPVLYLNDPKAWVVTTPGPAFSPRKNDLAMRFALRAIARQPVDYLLIVGRDLADTFLRQDPPLHPTLRFGFPGPAADAAVAAAIRSYAPAPAVTEVAPLYARLLLSYQARIYLPGLAFAVVMLIGPAGFAARRRRAGRPLAGESAGPRQLAWLADPGLVAWTAATMILVLSVAIDEAEYRFAVPVVPLACIAAACAFARAGRQPAAARQRAVLGTPDGGEPVAPRRAAPARQVGSPTGPASPWPIPGPAPSPEGRPRNAG